MIKRWQEVLNLSPAEQRVGAMIRLSNCTFRNVVSVSVARTETKITLRNIPEAVGDEIVHYDARTPLPRPGRSIFDCHLLAIRRLLRWRTKKLAGRDSSAQIGPACASRAATRRAMREL